MTRGRNYIKIGLCKFTLPSILLIITGFIGLIKYFLYPSLPATEDMLLAAFNLCFFVGIGFLINKNYTWTKYIVFVMAVLGLFNFPAIRLDESTTIAVISFTFILQRILLVAAAILLFKPFLTNSANEN